MRADGTHAKRNSINPPSPSYPPVRESYPPLFGAHAALRHHPYRVIARRDGHLGPRVAGGLNHRVLLGFRSLIVIRRNQQGATGLTFATKTDDAEMIIEFDLGHTILRLEASDGLDRLAILGNEPDVVGTSPESVGTLSKVGTCARGLCFRSPGPGSPALVKTSSFTGGKKYLGEENLTCVRGQKGTDAEQKNGKPHGESLDKRASGVASARGERGRVSAPALAPRNHFNQWRQALRPGNVGCVARPRSPLTRPRSPLLRQHRLHHRPRHIRQAEIAALEANVSRS